MDAMCQRGRFLCVTAVGGELSLKSKNGETLAARLLDKPKTAS
jgi:hypothetical protein